MKGSRLMHIAVLLGASGGCSRVLPGGGLMVVLRSDPSLDPAPRTLHVEVDPVDGGEPYRDGEDFRLDGGLSSRPVTFAVDSNGDPGASVRFFVSASPASGNWPTETLRYEVDAIPTDRVAELDVVFRAACAPRGGDDGGSGESCCPSLAAGCRWDGQTCVCSGADLPAFPSDGGETFPDPPETSADATFDATADAPSDATRDAPSEATSDATVESGVVGEGGTLDAAPCEAGAVQCADPETPLQCGPDGQWQGLPRCQYGFTYCSAGACIPIPRSCSGNIGSDCDSDEVPPGAFYRGKDPLHEDAGAPATISAFRLDTYEVEVWRFRHFVDAVEQGIGLPDAGSGKHSHLAHGQGLSGGGDGGAYETGWDAAWDPMFPTLPDTWNANLSCANSATWTAEPSQNDELPIDCVTWYEAYAFCIWDGAFLPSEAEWNYAAAAGSEQRLYPWGSTDPGLSSEYAVYACLYPQLMPCNSPTALDIATVDSFPMGAGAFGQRHLAGNVAEWTFDLYDPSYPMPCDDCAGLSGSQRVFRGGAFDRQESYLYTSMRVPAEPSARYRDVGVRCARTP